MGSLDTDKEEIIFIKTLKIICKKIQKKLMLKEAQNI